MRDNALSIEKINCLGTIQSAELIAVDVLGAYVALSVKAHPNGTSNPIPVGTWCLPVALCKALLAEIIAETANAEAGIQTAQ